MLKSTVAILRRSFIVAEDAMCGLTAAICPGQTEMQVFKLASSLVSVLPDFSALVMTRVHFGRDQICTQINAKFSPFCRPAQVNPSWLLALCLHLTAWKLIFFSTSVHLRVHLATKCKATQIQLAITCAAAWSWLYWNQYVFTCKYSL